MAALVLVLGLIAVPLVTAARMNVAALRLVHGLDAAPASCRVHPALCIPINTRPSLANQAETFANATTADAFSVQAAALGYAAAGNVARAAELLQARADRLSLINLGRLYWSLGQSELAIRTWRNAGDVVWLALLFMDHIEPPLTHADGDLLLTTVLDHHSGSYEADVLSGLLALKFAHYRSAVTHFERALQYRPDDKRVLMRLAEAYGSAPREQIDRKEHTLIAAYMEAAVRFDPGYSDLHVLAALSACLGKGDYASATRGVERAKQLGFGRLPDDLSLALVRKCEMESEPFSDVPR